MDKVLNFENNNFIGYLDSRWVLKNCILNGNCLVINPSGTATLELEQEVNCEFKYVRLQVEYSCDGVTSENNYKSNPTIAIKEVYKNSSSNEVEQVYFRALGFNTFDTTENGFSDTTIYETANRKMAKYILTITNKTGSPLTIYSISAYKSIDISESQVSTITNSIIKQGAASTFRVYHKDDAVKSLGGIGVLIGLSGYELKFKPEYYQCQLISISTNAGQTVAIEHLLSEIDLTT